MAAKAPSVPILRSCAASDHADSALAKGLRRLAGTFCCSFFFDDLPASPCSSWLCLPTTGVSDKYVAIQVFWIVKENHNLSLPARVGGRMSGGRKNL